MSMAATTQLGVSLKRSRRRSPSCGRLQTVITKIVAPERVVRDMSHMDPSAMPQVILISFIAALQLPIKFYIGI